ARAHGAARAARQARRGLGDPDPRPGAVARLRRLAPRAHPASLGRVDALEHAAADRHRAPRVDRARDGAARELLLVRLALAIAVEELRDGRVAPVDDAHAAADARRAAEADVALAAVLDEAHVREVRRAAAHARRGARGAELAQQRAAAVPLLEQREPVLLLLAGEQERPHALELADDRLLGGVVPARLVGERAQHVFEQAQLLAHDGMRQRAALHRAGQPL